MDEHSYEATIVPHPQPDPMVPRVYSVRVAKETIPSNKLDGFFAEATKDGLKRESRTVEQAEVWELT